MTDTPNPFDLYQYGEGKTGIGQTVEFSCPSGRIPDVQEFLKTTIRTIRPPVTTRVLISHGGYGGFTRYDVVQHKYGGGGSGFIEVLEIRNPPEDRCGIVMYEYNSYGGSFFTEWTSLEKAVAAWEKGWKNRHREEELPQLPGFIRLVRCNALTPWFYALGTEELVGDYVFPHGLEDDAVYRFGEKFIVYGYEGIPSVKTCMGSRFVTKKEDNYPHRVHQYRVIYWDDGSTWHEGYGAGGTPRRLEDGELWITEAIDQFRKLLAGHSTEFSITFTNDTKFVGKVVGIKHKNPSAAGDYLLRVNLKGESKPKEGWVRDFSPSIECPDIVQFVTKQYERGGNEVERVEIVKVNTKSAGKKWSGVFFGRK